MLSLFFYRIMKSIIIFGKGTSVSRCTPEFVNKYDDRSLLENFDEYEGSGIYGGDTAMRMQTVDVTGVGGHTHEQDPSYLRDLLY